MPSLSQQFQEAIDSGLISCRKHPTDDLWILNYTQECQFSKAWNDVTLQCRGLIVNAEGKFVARPFRKFFNLSEHDNPEMPRVPHGSRFKAYEKLDGSLGIAYWGSGGWEIATRGSFESEQAHKATAMLSHAYKEAMQKMNPYLTYLFEIIYPENRIVVDYGKEQKLVLLGVIRTADGEELSLGNFSHLGFPLPHVFDVNDIASLPRDTHNFEGYVIRFENGFRVKVKLDDYVRLHKIMTGITPNRVWEMLAAEQNVEDFVKDLPDEMYDELMDVVNDLRAEHVSLLSIHSVFLTSQNLKGMTRKEQALRIIDACKRTQSMGDLLVSLNTSLMFALLDCKFDLAKEMAWKLVKPKDGNKLICKADFAG